MRILHLVGDLRLPRDPDSEGTSGAVRVALELARAQVRLGHEPWVAAVGWDRWEERWHGVTLAGLKAAPWAAVQWRARTLDFRVHLPYVVLTRTRRFDIVHGHLYSYLRLLGARARIAHFHTDPLYRGGGELDISLSSADSDLVARTTQAQVAVSRFVARQIVQAFGWSDSVHVVHNGVHASRFDPDRYRQERGRLRAEWGVSDDAVVFLYAGAIVPEKGVVHLARAFGQLREQAPHVHLAVAGGSVLWIQSLAADDPVGDYERGVRAALEAASQGGKVHLLGRVGAGAMPAVYAACDVVVVPSIWKEAFGLVALEALAAGRPVIASNTGGLPEVVDATTGVLVPPGDEAALCRAMYALANDPARRARLGLAGRARALAFSWEATARAVDSVYSECLGQRSAS